MADDDDGDDRGGGGGDGDDRDDGDGDGDGDDGVLFFDTFKGGRQCQTIDTAIAGLSVSKANQPKHSATLPVFLRLLP